MCRLRGIVWYSVSSGRARGSGPGESAPAAALQTVAGGQHPQQVEYDEVPVEGEGVAVSVVEGHAGDHYGLDLPSLPVRLVQLGGDELHLPRHGEHPLRHGARPQAFVQLLLNATENRNVLLVKQLGRKTAST